MKALPKPTARCCAFPVQGIAQKPSEPVENWSAWIPPKKNCSQPRIGHTSGKTLENQRLIVFDRPVARVGTGWRECLAHHLLPQSSENTRFARKAADRDVALCPARYAVRNCLYPVGPSGVE